ncbi:MAG TPA: aminotransferase class I/II-fold pyridoxal phosphate-dependent enzyme [Candidatus Egerieicola pullicola]|uniref:Aminotransferase n=1 Tax=Candidatus Egerieicola pullicola TaxID=2840775 RepID=A0A9D1AIU5_9FIRM|nr:aminotransferase class I/II-fold pyridoxal phosphate-dependent enzyme [Candidatus Egerieicola pullicola]
MDYQKYLSPVANGLKPSGIRRFFDIAAEMDHVISLGVGEPDFKTPWAIRQEAIRTLEKGKTWYTANAGLAELREEIARYLKDSVGVEYCPKNQILVSVGGSEAIDLCVRALVKPGDEVLIPEPSFVCYDPIVQLAGGTPVSIETKVENQFRLTPEELEEKITPRTKLLVLPYPNNPTGAVMKREHLEAIAPVIQRHDLLVLSDEIYSELTYSGKHVSIASLPGMDQRTVVINGFSKSFAMTGWRLGFAAGPAPILQLMVKIHQYAIMSAPTMSQYAAVEALRHCRSSVAEMREEYNLRRRFLVDALNKMGLDCFEPEGAFYVFPSITSTGMTSEEFCETLLQKERVAVVPGDAFGKSGEGHVRISYSYSINYLKEALKRIQRFVRQCQEGQP